MRNPSNAVAQENRNKIGAELANLAQPIASLLGPVIEDALKEGHWSLDDLLAPETRMNVRAPDDIARSEDLSLVLSVMLNVWAPLALDNDLGLYGITFQLVDKVRRVRNEFAHSLGNYNDAVYVDDCLRAVGALHQGFLDLRVDQSIGTQTITQPSQTAPDLVMQAKKELNAERFNDAVVDSTMAIANDPNDPDAYLIRGMAYRRQRDYEGAVNDLRKAIMMAPNNADSHIELGWVYIEGGLYEQAIRAFDAGIQRLPGVPSLWNDRGVAREYNGQTQQAMNDYDRATKVDPNHAPAWANLGHLYTDMGQIDMGIAQLDRAIGLNPGLAWIWNNRGYAYLRSKKYGKAIADFQQSVQLDPYYHLAQANLTAARGLRRKRFIRWSLAGIGLFGIGLLLILWSIMAI